MTEQYSTKKGMAEEPDTNFGFGEEQAREILEERAGHVTPEDVEQLNSRLREKAEALRDLEDGMHWVGTLIGRAKLLFGMIRDRSFQIDMSTKMIVAAGLLYFVVPTDMLPDFIPGIGYIDDALVLGTLWKLVTDELERYVDFLHVSGRGDATLDSIAFEEDEPDDTAEPTSAMG